MASDIDDLLRKLRSDGKADSEGSFTLNLQATREKLALYGQLQPEFWILKVLQSAACWEASKVDIEFGRRGLIIRFDYKPDLRIEDFTEALNNLLSRTPASELILAILSTIRTTGEPATLSLHSQEEFALLRIPADDSGIRIELGTDRKHYKIGKQMEIRAVRRRAWPTLRQFAAQPLREVLHRTVAETQAVRESCLYHPSTVTLDGLETPRQFRITRPKSEHHRTLFRLVHFELEPPPGGLGISPRLSGRLRTLEGKLQLNQRVFSNEPFIYHPSEKLPGGAISFIVSQTRANSRIDFVHRGIVVESHTLVIRFKSLVGEMIDRFAEHEFARLEIVLEVEDGDLDLTGMAIRQPQMLIRRRIDPEKEKFLFALEKARAQLPKLITDNRVRTSKLETQEYSTFLTFKDYWNKRRDKALQAAIELLKDNDFNQFLKT